LPAVARLGAVPRRLDRTARRELPRHARAARLRGAVPAVGAAVVAVRGRERAPRQLAGRRARALPRPRGRAALLARVLDRGARGADERRVGARAALAGALRARPAHRADSGATRPAVRARAGTARRDAPVAARLLRGRVGVGRVLARAPGAPARAA